MIREETYLQNINCPVCGSGESEPLFSVTHQQSNVLRILKLTEDETAVNIVECKNCGHKYMTPVIREELMNRYYSILNSEFYHSEKEIYNQNVREYEDYSRIIQQFKKEGSVLEIGCGNGFLLKTLENIGYDCHGVEPSPAAFGYAKHTLNLDVENKFLSESSFFNSEFDVVIFIDVAEHITHMQTFMNEVSQVLKKGGMLFIGTGNIDSLNARLAKADWNYFLSWEHVSFFNKKSMSYLLQQNNFQDIIIRKTSLQHKPLQNISEFAKNLAKKIFNPLLKHRYYHGITFDHFIITAVKKG
jgi:2-polyprenyl-3-methyl-5-hydroxy-6-metoxy-1,4-benzoquinol methylase